MIQLVKTLLRVATLCVAVGCISGCTGWIERQTDIASRAIDCAVLASASVPTTARTEHCERHPAAQG